MVDGLPLAWSKVIYDAVNLYKTCSAHRPAQRETHARSTVSIAQAAQAFLNLSRRAPGLVRWEHFWGDQRNSEVKQLLGKMADKHPAAVPTGKAAWMPGSEMHYWKSGELRSSSGAITCSQSVRRWWKMIRGQGVTCSRVCGDLTFCHFWWTIILTINVCYEMNKNSKELINQSRHEECLCRKATSFDDCLSIIHLRLQWLDKLPSMERCHHLQNSLSLSACFHWIRSELEVSFGPSR